MVVTQSTNSKLTQMDPGGITPGVQSQDAATNHMQAGMAPGRKPHDPAGVQKTQQMTNGFAATAGLYHQEGAEGTTQMAKKRDMEDDSPTNSLDSGKEQSYTGGYQVDTVDEVRSDIICPICLHILRIPIQTSCGHRFCQSCIRQVLSSSGPDPRCPEDRLPLDEVFRDRHCEREIACLAVRCRNYTQCGWTGQLKENDAHLTTCPFELVPCSNRGCKAMVQRQDFQQHVQEECPHRLTVCQFCQEGVPHSQLQIHVNNHCQEVIINCTAKGCTESFPRRFLLPHLDQHCLAVEEPCGFGCGQKVRRGDFQLHCTEPSAMSAHLVAMRSQMIGLQQELRRKDDVITQQHQQLTQLKSDMETSVTKGLEKLGARVDVLQQAAGHQTRSLDSGVERRLQRRMSSLENDVQVAVRKNTEVQVATGQQQHVTQELAQQFDQLDLRVMELETTSYDGFLIWRVPNFSKLLADAERGVKTSHYSQPFYCGRYGYKACARLYPNGDGAGHGKYISLFLVLMAGEFDSILPWPFTRRVTLTLLDQSPTRRHISETFSPDVRSSSFQRPTSGLNVASGCPSFVSHQILRSSIQQYLKDDTLFLKLKIDITGMEHM